MAHKIPPPPTVSNGAVKSGKLVAGTLHPMRKINAVGVLHPMTLTAFIILSERNQWHYLLYQATLLLIKSHCILKLTTCPNSPAVFAEPKVGRDWGVCGG